MIFHSPARKGKWHTNSHPNQGIRACRCLSVKALLGLTGDCSALRGWRACLSWARQIGEDEKLWTCGGSNSIRGLQTIFPRGKSNRHKKAAARLFVWPKLCSVVLFPVLPGVSFTNACSSSSARSEMQAPMTMCILGEGRDYGGAYRNRNRLTVHLILGICWTTRLSLSYCRGQRPQG